MASTKRVSGSVGGFPKRSLSEYSSNETDFKAVMVSGFASINMNMASDYPPEAMWLISVRG